MAQSAAAMNLSKKVALRLTSCDDLHCSICPSRDRCRYCCCCCYRFVSFFFNVAVALVVADLVLVLAALDVVGILAALVVGVVLVLLDVPLLPAAVLVVAVAMFLACMLGFVAAGLVPLLVLLVLLPMPLMSLLLLLLPSLSLMPLFFRPHVPFCPQHPRRKWTDCAPLYRDRRERRSC